MTETTMTGTPLPCPFCGAELTQHNLVHGGIAWMHHDAETWCPARGVQCYSAATQAAWNRRTPDPSAAETRDALVEALRETRQMVADARDSLLRDGSEYDEHGLPIPGSVDPDDQVPIDDLSGAVARADAALAKAAA